MVASYDICLCFIILLSIQFCGLESSNDFVDNKINKIKYKHGSDAASLGSFPIDKVCNQNVACHKDELGFQAIAMLHAQIDDDQNGNLDRSESQDFLKQDLKRESLSCESHYHGNDDLVSVQDLWNFWVLSEVHNWTVEDVIVWLEVHVELGQYSQQFRKQEVDGALLPRLASSVQNPLYNSLGVRNVKHRQKIVLRATDIILFGIPKSQRSMFSDSLFIFSVMLALAGCGLGYRQHKLAKLQLSILTSDLKNLQSAEDALKKFQAQLEESRKAQREEEDKRDELNRMLVNKEFKASLKILEEEEYGDLKINNIQEELSQYRVQLMEAELRLEECRRASIPDLQQWLQLTYEIEARYIEERGNEVFKKLQEAKNMCESMRRQKLKLLSSIRSPTRSQEFKTSDVNQSLEEIKVDLQERALRWKEIERITSFNITTNPGIPYLNTLLRGTSVIPIPGMITSPSMNKMNALPVINKTDDPIHDNMTSLPENLSHTSLVSLDRKGGLSSVKFLKHNNHGPINSFSPPYHINKTSGMQRHPHKSMPLFFVSPLDGPSFDPDGNSNNSIKHVPPNNCNGVHHKEVNKIRAPLKFGKNN